MATKLFDSTIVSTSEQALDFIGNILESSTEYSIIGKDLTGRILLWNEGARRLYGYEPEEVIGKANSSMLHTPEDVQAGKHNAIMETALRDGKWEGTINRLRKNGQRFTARIVMTPRRDPAGNPVGFLLISKDISDEIQLTEELKATQFYTRSLIESNIDALMTTDPLGIITDVNQQMGALTGHGRDELIGTFFKNYFTDPQRAEDGIRLVLREGKVTNYELTALSKDGRMTVVSYNASTFRDSGGRLQGVFAAARDITEQKKLEQQLRESESYNRGLIEASVDGLITVDSAGLISDVNEQMSRMSGYPREELIGTPFSDYFVDSNRATAGVQETFDKGVVTDYVLTLATRGARQLQVSFNASVFRDPAGKVRGIFASARDITDQARLQSQLAEERAYNRGLIEASLDGLITVNPMLAITDVNDTMCRMSGYSREELIGAAFPSYFVDSKRAADGVRLTLDKGAVTNYELTLRTKDKRSNLVSFNAAIFKDEADQVRGIFASARDITDQARLQSQLAEEQAYNRGLIEASVDGLVTVDEAMFITDVNDTMCRMVGRPRNKLTGSSFSSYFTETERAAQGVRQTFKEGSVTNYVLTLLAADGHQVPVSFNAAVFKDTAGKVRGIFASARDITSQKQLESQLQASQTYTRSLIESNIDALMTTDALGIITDVNQQMEMLTGGTRADLIGTPFKTYFTDPDRAEAGIRQVLREGKVTNYELTAKSKTGRQIVVSYNAVTFNDAEGNLQGVFAAARDITEQKKLEQQLREQQTYLRGLIESSVDGLITVDPSGTITDINDRMCQMSGYTRAELVGTPFADYFTEPDRARQGVQQTFDAGFVTEYALTIVSRTRRLLQVSFNASVFKDQADQVRGIFASARDITDRVRLEEQLREQQTYLRGLIESSVDGLITVDPEGFITDVNEQMCRMTGYARAELIGSSFKRYFTEPERADQGVKRTFADGVVTNYELVLQTKAGRKATVSFNASVFRGADNRVQGIFASARDISEQARLSGQLAEQQAYNRSLIEASADALFAIAPDGMITDVNAEAARVTGYTRKHLINSRFADYFTEPDRARTGVQQTMQAGRVLGYELVLITRHGRRIMVSFNAGVFTDAAGNPLGILAAARDITQQKQIEQEVHDQQSYTRSLIESNIDALMTTDPIGIITDVNRQMCEVTGRSREELIGTPFKTYFTEPQQAEDGIRKVLAEDQVTNYELTIRSKNGRETVVSYNATTFKGADGKLRGVFAAARDITDQKRLEGQVAQRNLELTEASTFLNNVLESSTEYSIIAKDLQGNVLTWNEGARRNYGYSAEEMVGRQQSRILHTPEDIESGKVQVLLDTAYQTGKAEGVFERVRKDGHRFTASVAITLRKDAAGIPIGYLLISKDITEQKRLEEQLTRKNEELEEQYLRVQEANRLKSEFLANMSHELRTPLNSIIGFTQLMHDGKAGPLRADQKEYMGDILTSSRHLLQLINDVLDLSKVESGKMEFFPELVEMPALVGEVRDILRSIAGSKRIVVSTEVAPELGDVTIDAAKFKQVLYNYLSNALKFTPDDGQVTVRVKAEGEDRFRLEVEDTGIGIRPEDLSRLFIEFQQLDASTAKKYAGTGLGLALTKRLVEAQSGTVGVQSTYGKGSVFFAVLPRTTYLLQQVEPNLTTLPRPGAPKVLVVEDESKDRRWLAQTIGEAGYHVETAATGAEAQVKCREQEFDAITLDLLLPDMNGRDVLAVIQREGLNQRTPVIVVTVVSEKGIVTGYNVHEIFQKPVAGDDLVAALRRLRVEAKDSNLVMVVDDDPQALKLGERTLKKIGYKMVCVENSREALARIAKEPPDVLVLDLLMPEMNGFEFLAQLRETATGRRLPVIVWTNKDVTEQERARLLSSVRAVITKTQGPEALVQAVQACVPLPAAQAQAEQVPRG